MEELALFGGQVCSVAACRALLQLVIIAGAAISPRPPDRAVKSVRVQSCVFGVCCVCPLDNAVLTRFSGQRQACAGSVFDEWRGPRLAHLRAAGMAPNTFAEERATKTMGRCYSGTKGD